MSLYYWRATEIMRSSLKRFLLQYSIIYRLIISEWKYITQAFPGCHTKLMSHSIGCRFLLVRREGGITRSSLKWFLLQKHSIKELLIIPVAPPPLIKSDTQLNATSIYATASRRCVIYMHVHSKILKMIYYWLLQKNIVSRSSSWFQSLPLPSQ